MATVENRPFKPLLRESLLARVLCYVHLVEYRLTKMIIVETQKFSNQPIIVGRYLLRDKEVVKYEIVFSANGSGVLMCSDWMIVWSSGFSMSVLTAIFQVDLG